MAAIEGRLLLSAGRHRSAVILAFLAAIVALVVGPQVALGQPLGGPATAAVERSGTGHLDAATVVAPARPAEVRFDHDGVDLVLAPITGVVHTVAGVVVTAVADLRAPPAARTDAQLARGPPSSD